MSSDNLARTTSASSSANDEKEQYCEAWAKSWRQLQEEQLNGYMRCMQRCLQEQSEALQAVMDSSFDQQVSHMRRLLDESGKLNLSNATAALEKPREHETADDKEAAEDVQHASSDTDPGLEQHKDLGLAKRPEYNHSVSSQFRDSINWTPAVEREKPERLRMRRASSVEHSGTIQPVDSCQQTALKITNSIWFEGCSALLVMLNTITIGIEADHALKSSLRTGTYETIFPKWVDAIFASCFCAELFCRILAERHHFCHSSRLTWNVFDVVVVGSAVVELIFHTINFSFIRVLRVFRMLKVVRIIRVFGTFRPLRLMISSIMTSFLTLIWTLVLLSLFVFLFAIILVQGISNYIEDTPHIPADIRLELDKNFPTLQSAAYTLLTTISGGQDWVAIAELFDSIATFYFCIFTFYQCFIIFGVLNILTGVFVDSAANISRVDHELVLQAEMDRNESFLNQVEELFTELDVDKSGTIEWQEFSNHLEDPRVHAYFAELQMDITEAKGLFQLLDTRDTGSIAIEEFVMGCMRLKGMAKSIDVATMLYETKKNAQHVDELHGQLQALDEKVNQNTAAMQSNTRRLVALGTQVHENSEAMMTNSHHIVDLDSKVQENHARAVELAVNQALLSHDKAKTPSPQQSNAAPPMVWPIPSDQQLANSSPASQSNSIPQNKPRRKAHMENFQSMVMNRLVEHNV